MVISKSIDFYTNIRTQFRFTGGFALAAIHVEQLAFFDSVVFIFFHFIFLIISALFVIKVDRMFRARRARRELICINPLNPLSPGIPSRSWLPTEKMEGVNK